MLVKSVFCLTFVFCFAKTLCNDCYYIPMPSITVYKPRGLTISIPNEVGVNLAIFYVSVNKDVINERADYTQYVVEEVNGKWSFDNLNIKVKNRDVLYYKIFVQKYNRGYLYTGTPYLVTERYKQPTYEAQQPHRSTNDCDETIIPDASSTTPSPTTLPTPSTTPPLTTTTYDSCPSSLNTALQLLFDAQTKLANAKIDLEAMEQIAMTQPLYLHLSGPVTETGEPKQVVEFVLYEKLNTRQSVKNASKNGTTITFELFSFEQKLDILRRAKQYLTTSQNILITP